MQQLEACQCPTRKLKHCSNRGDGAIIRNRFVMRRTATQAMCLHTAKQAGKRRRDAPESEVDSTGLLLEWKPGSLAPGVRIIPLDQAAIGFAMEYIYANTHLKRNIYAVSCVEGIIEFACRNSSLL